ncbi:MAG: hypothetical protein QM656_16910, partial [Paracoccaceae bacterium]
PEAAPVAEAPPPPVPPAPAAQPETPAPAPGAEDQPAPRFATPVDLARATQEELKRIGCYNSTVDGDWGNGSRKALGRYFDAVETEPDGLEPTEALYDELKAAPEDSCKPIAAAAPAPVKPSAPKKSAQQATKKAPPATARKAPAAAAAPAQGTAKKKVECKWVVVAIVCK